MTTSHNRIFKLLLCTTFLFLSFSCSKDADLLSDYVISDKNDLESIALLTNDIYFINPSQSSILLDVLNNDSFDDSAQVNIIATSEPKNGSVKINTDNTLTYTPRISIAAEQANTDTVTSPEESQIIEESQTIAAPQAPEATETPEEDSFEYTTEVTTEDGETFREQATVTITPNEMGELKAFPTAYGAGAYSVGGRGQSVYKVTNLNDRGAGSLRDALSQGNRTIVFEVSGTIELASGINANINNVTIAGQTAPAGGITITGNVINLSGDNIIMRYIRARPDFDKSGTNDVINTTRLTNSIFDHLSVSWGGDEIVSMVINTNNNTIQNCLMAESKTGQIMGDSQNPSTGGSFSVLRNAYYNISHRFPNPVTDERADIINNLIYNHYYRLMTFSPSTDIDLNWIGNYIQSPCGQNNRTSSHEINWIDYNGGKSENIYAEGNLLMPAEFTNPSGDNRFFFQYRNPPSGVKQWSTVNENYFVSNPFPFLGASLPITNPLNVKESVLNDVGARWVLSENGQKIESIDTIDRRYIDHMTNNVCFDYKWLQDYSQYAHYKTWHSNVSNIPLASYPASRDSDNDGMPDAWELSRFENLSRDGKGDINGDGYTDLEEFLNLVDF
ncbi:Ig-like domain-containing protein [Maribacter chungangensis]|uniref:Ig-like domain-containing protein n=1 Tax=Maribacter chungangensis TaxID=1069117 RepID=A0ABW3B860_9FLAO